MSNCRTRNHTYKLRDNLATIRKNGSVLSMQKPNAKFYEAPLDTIKFVGGWWGGGGAPQTIYHLGLKTKGHLNKA